MPQVYKMKTLGKNPQNDILNILFLFFFMTFFQKTLFFTEKKRLRHAAGRRKMLDVIFYEKKSACGTPQVGGKCL